MTNFGRPFDFAQRRSIDALCRPSRLAISAVDILSSFQDKIRALSSFFSFPGGGGAFQSAISQNRKKSVFALFF
jgi:hypothetical protein